jgi:hypothetical protein
MLTGLYLFALPYANRWRAGRSNTSAGARLTSQTTAI